MEIVCRQRVDADQLHGEVVFAAALIGGLHDGLRRGVQVVGVGRKSLMDERGVEVLADTVGGQHVDVASLHRQ
ncbi:hypothetical protein D9M68_898150 [compost metagenome]